MTLRAHADREHAYLEVEDDGPGVPAVHAPHVFDRFYRAEGGVASGSGLGLAIARELAPMMGGEVVLESQPGRTVVRVVLGAAPTSVAGARGARARFHVKTPADEGRTPLQCEACVQAPSRWSRSSPPRSARRPCSWSAAVAGWIADDGGTRTVVLPDRSPRTPARAGPASVAAPLVGNGFDPARIYASRSQGVVTIYSYFADGQRSQGSGFVVSDDGHVLTNSHVVTNAGARPRRCAAPPGSTSSSRTATGFPARSSAGTSSTTPASSRSIPSDHAVSPVPLGDSSRVVVGEPVAAIGSPFGQESSLAVGVVSATERSIESLTSAYDVSGAIQVDAPINHGNSGGPLLDARGRVIGINAQIRSDSGNAEGVGFAIPINSARRSMEQLISTGKVAYAYVGVTTQDVTPALARKFELGAPRGALIQSVVEDAPAAQAGLRGLDRTTRTSTASRSASAAT